MTLTGKRRGDKISEESGVSEELKSSREMEVF
jgi:hypothetical protein